MKNKRGWIKVTEAVIAILLLIAIILVALKEDIPQNETKEQEIHNAQRAILREIQLTESLRDEIIGTDDEVEWADLPAGTKSKIEDETPVTLDCVAKICSPSDECILPDGIAPESTDEENIYVETVMITTNTETYKPRVVKLFCWEL